MSITYERIAEIPELAVDSVNYGHISLAYRRQRALASPRTAKTKKRDEVRMSSSKWFRQKGTGRARQGPKSTPHLRGGGVVFGPIPGVRTSRLNRKVRRSALRSAILFHLEAGAAKVIKGGEFNNLVKTKAAYNALLQSQFEGKGLVVVSREAPVLRALRNIAGITALYPDRLNVVDLVNSNFIIFTEDALEETKLYLSGAIEEEDFGTMAVEPNEEGGQQ